MVNKKEIIDDSLALVEMYKAGFLDGYRKGFVVRSKDDYILLNKDYKLSFNQRFGKKITKALKKKK